MSELSECSALDGQLVDPWLTSHTHPLLSSLPHLFKARPIFENQPQWTWRRRELIHHIPFDGLTVLPWREYDIVLRSQQSYHIPQLRVGQILTNAGVRACYDQLSSFLRSSSPSSTEQRESEIGRLPTKREGRKCLSISHHIGSAVPALGDEFMRVFETRWHFAVFSVRHGMLGDGTHVVRLCGAVHRWLCLRVRNGLLCGPLRTVSDEALRLGQRGAGEEFR